MAKTYRIILFLLSFLCITPILAVTKADQLVYKSFWQPTYHQIRLNYCFADGVTCGLPVATRYCQRMGYEKAIKHIIDNNVGLSVYFGTRIFCKNWTCNGFKNINCARHASLKPKPYHYRYRRFFSPCYKHKRVDWCYDGSKGCGKRAALSFCRRMGYMQVKHFSPEAGVHATQAIANQKLCLGPHCCAFREIDCYR